MIELHTKQKYSKLHRNLKIIASIFLLVGSTFVYSDYNLDSFRKNRQQEKTKEFLMNLLVKKGVDESEIKKIEFTTGPRYRTEFYFNGSIRILMPAVDAEFLDDFLFLSYENQVKYRDYFNRIVYILGHEIEHVKKRSYVGSIQTKHFFKYCAAWSLFTIATYFNLKDSAKPMRNLLTILGHEFFLAGLYVSMRVVTARACYQEEYDCDFDASHDPDLIKAGIDFYKLFIPYEKNRHDWKFFDGMFYTHPPAKNRVAALEQKLAKIT